MTINYKFITRVSTYCFIVVCFFICSNSSIAQNNSSLEYATININKELQLKSIETYQIKKDSKGYLWVCTDLGVYMYDGFNSKHFTKNDGLLSNVIFETYEDYHGRIWFLGKSTALCYYQNGEIFPYKYNNKIREYCPYSSTDRKEIHVIENDVYYATNSCGVIKISDTGEQKIYNETPGISSFDVLPNNKLVFSYTYTDRKIENIYENGIFSNLIHLNYKNKIYKIDSLNPERNEKFDLKYLRFLDNKLHGVGIIGSNLVKFPEKKILLKNVSSFSKDFSEENAYWVGTSQGCIRLELTNSNIVKIDDILSLKGNFISSIYSDSNGNTFFTSLENGVFFLSKQHITKLRMDEKLIGDQDLIDMTIFKDQLFVSTKKKVINLSRGIESFGHFSLLHNYRDSLLFISDIHSQVKKYTHLPENKDYIAYNFTRDFIELNKSLYSVTNFLMKYEINTGKYSFPYQSNHSLVKDQNLKLLEKFNNTLYFSSSSRIFKYQKDSTYLIKYFPDIEITDFLILDSAKFLISTKSQGLQLLQGDSLEKIKSLEYLPQLKYSTCLLKYKNYVLIGTYQGLVIFDLQRNQGISAGPNHGFKNKKVKFIKSIKDQLYITVANEIYTLNENQIKQMFLKSKDRNKINATLTELYVDGKKTNLETKEISYFSDFIHFVASIKDYSTWRNRKYQYRLNKNQHWNTILSPELTISNPQKSFTLELRYQQNDGSWSNSIINRNFRISAPFYKRTWFLILSISVFGLIIYILVKSRLNRKIRELIAEKNLTSHQQRLQNARIRPHFIFNVLNSINSHIIFEENSKASNYLIKFSKMLRKVLDYSGQENTLLSEELSLITAYLELEQLRNDKLIFSITKLNGLNDVKIPSLLIQPIVENAVLHGKENELSEHLIKVEIDAIDAACLKVCVSNTVNEQDIKEAKWNFLSDKNAIGISVKRLTYFNTLNKTNKFKISYSLDKNELTACIYLPIIDDSSKNN